jgi:hypothetical protein
MPRLPCHDIIFFIAAISIFSSPRYRFFFAAISIFSSARYQFFLCRDIDFFTPSQQYSFGLTAAPHHGDIHSALQPRPITAIFLWPYSRRHHGDIHSALQLRPIMAIFFRPYSRAPSRRYSFGLTAALFTLLFLHACPHPLRQSVAARCAFTRALFLRDNPSLFGRAFARAPILCNNPLLFGQALARAPILCNNPSLFGRTFACPHPLRQSFVVCRAFALAPILCNDPLLFTVRLRCLNPLR